jgi:hypothetical protein
LCSCKGSLPVYCLFDGLAERCGRGERATSHPGLLFQVRLDGESAAAQVANFEVGLNAKLFIGG